MLKKLAFCLTIFLTFATGFASADEKKSQVLSIMDAAVAHFEAVGKEQAYKDFSVKGSQYFQGEFYIAAYSMTSELNEFHAANPKLVGKNLMKLKDTDGKLILQVMYDVAKKDGSGWVDYKWVHPETKKIAQKQTFVKVVGDVFLLIGYYE